jgi:hypothetical protein
VPYAECYDGPPETEGVGLCAGGFQECAVTPVCSGQVLPAAEDCSTSEDEDCDAAPECPGDTIWAAVFGGEADDSALGLAIDAAGNVVITGDYKDTVDFGGGPLVSPDGWERLYVAKLDPEGKHVWSKDFGDGGNLYGRKYMTIDTKGDLVLVGSFGGTVDFGGGPLDTGMYVAKIDGLGAHIFSKGFSNGARPSAVAATPDGGFVVCGRLVDAADMGSGVLTPKGESDVLLAKFDASGAVAWAKSFGDDEAQWCNAVAVASNGDITLTGSFFGTLDFGGEPRVCGYSSDGASWGGDIFLAKLDTTGAPVWSRSFGASPGNEGWSVGVDAGGAVYLAAVFGASIDLGGGPLQGMSSATLVARFAPDGTHAWGKVIDPRGWGLSPALGVASDGSVVVVAGDGFGSGIGLATKLDVSGAVVWARQYMELNPAGLWQGAVRMDSTGNVVIAGQMHGTVDLGRGELDSNGLSDILVAKLLP